MNSSIIIVAAGSGSRFGQPKLFVQLAGKTLLEWNLEVIQHLNFEKEVVIVLQPEHREKVRVIVDRFPELDVKFADGGKERIDSSRNGLAASSGDIVMLHNVANPMVQPQDYQQLHDLLVKQDAACFVGIKAVDTLRRIQGGESQTIDRTDVWRVQTPQGFRRSILIKVLETKSDHATDEVMMFEGSDIPIRAFETSPLNQKITYPADLELLERYLTNDVLVGIGEDSHRFGEAGILILGGIEVEGMPRLFGNSDADVILHALYNAISSALGERSIAVVSDPMCLEEGITDSSEYLQVVLARVRELGYRFNNISISLECQKPKIEPLVDRMKERLSELLDLDPARIGITATSGEGMSREGMGEGIRCSSTVSLIRL